ncbi:MAG TPA: hypothetical protein VFU47_00480, partial [Armatimonadota bacterium]|nr:hypothetical protein [Armatimonadota bacterium]
MQTLPTHAQPDSPAFTENRAAMQALVDELRGRLAQVREGGGPAAREKHRARGKLPARDRIERLL